MPPRSSIIRGLLRPQAEEEPGSAPPADALLDDEMELDAGEPQAADSQDVIATAREALEHLATLYPDEASEVEMLLARLEALEQKWMADEPAREDQLDAVAAAEDRDDGDHEYR